MQGLQFDKLQPHIPPSMSSIVFDQAALTTISANFKGAKSALEVDDNARMIQPIIHSILIEAATKAQTLWKRDFRVIADPIIMESWKYLRSDEAVVEAVKLATKVDTIKILVEVKGTETFPYGFKPKRDFKNVISQLFHQTALALVAQKWTDEILVAAATFDHWYFMHIHDVSESVLSDVKLDVHGMSLSHAIAVPTFIPDVNGESPRAANTVSLEQLLQYLILYLSY